MIAKEELKIGNWVYILSYQQIKKGSDIDLSDGMDAIPLTSDILIKAGFSERQHCEDWYIKLPDTDTILSYRRKQLRICPVNAMPALHIDCLYVHMLQNLCFALTHQELNIEL